MTEPASTEAPSGLALLRQLAPHWRVTFAAFLGWFLDAFDQTALVLALPDIAKSFGVGMLAMGYVLTVQSLGRAVGNTAWGWLADRYGRKLAFMVGVLWFGAFSGLSGLAWCYAAMVVVQFLFGMGFGGEWTASAALLMESVPQKTRPIASALMMSGYEVGFFAAAAAQAVILPDHSWRWLFFIGLLPALLAIFIRLGVAESPVWQRAQENRIKTPRRTETPRARFRLDAAALQGITLMTLLDFQKASIYSFYPAILRNEHHLTPAIVFQLVTCYCMGSLLGKLVCGWLASRFGDTRVMLATLLFSALLIYPFLSGGSFTILALSALGMGTSASGIFALVPHYLAKRFPSETRSFGMGLGYGLASVGQAIASYVVPALGRGGMLAFSAEGCVIGASAAVGAVAAIEPRHLPGEHMEGDPL